MKIGELAAASSTPVETIRYYEREQLLPAPARTEGNFRTYEAAHLERVLFIRHCRSLDMSLDEIRQLLRIKDDPARDGGDADALIDAHIGHVTSRIAELRTLEKALRQLRRQCNGLHDDGHCGILDGLAAAAQEGVADERPRNHLR